MDERLRERIADIIVEREGESPLDRADSILQIPEIRDALWISDNADRLWRMRMLAMRHDAA